MSAKLVVNHQKLVIATVFNTAKEKHVPAPGYSAGLNHCPDEPWVLLHKSGRIDRFDSLKGLRDEVMKLGGSLK